MVLEEFRDRIAATKRLLKRGSIQKVSKAKQMNQRCWWFTWNLKDREKEERTCPLPLRACLTWTMCTDTIDQIEMFFPSMLVQLTHKLRLKSQGTIVIPLQEKFTR